MKFRTGFVLLWILTWFVPQIGYGAGAQVSLEYDAGLPKVVFAAGEIRLALEEQGYQIRSNQADVRIVMTLDTENMKPQCYRVRYDQANLLRVTGGDALGLMYGGLELAETLRSVKDLAQIPPREGKPFVAKRGLKFNIPLDARTPSYDDTGDSAQKNVLEMWNFDFWREFLDDMARHRYNVLSLWTTHPYPTLIKLDDYPDVAYDDVAVLTVPMDHDTDRHWNEIDITDPANYKIVKKITIDEKIAYWQRVMQYAEDRGIDIYLFHWNIHMHGALGKYGITHDQDNPKTVKYLRASVKQLLLTYPQIKGIGVTAGERVNRKLEGEYSIENWMWNTYGQGIMDAKAENADLSVRFIFRRHWSDLAKIKEAFADYTDPFETSIKYHRARIYTSTNPPYFDAWYREDLTNNNTKCWMNLRNDDVFSMRWGNPEHVRDFILNMPHDLLGGFYVGPDGYVWGREFISKEPEEPRELEISKHWYRFMLWGRLGYNPALDRTFFERTLTQRFPDVDASSLYDGWRAASHIIPEINRAHFYQNDLEWMAEACFDMKKGFHSVNRFITHEPDNKNRMAGKRTGNLSVRQYVAIVTTGEDIPGISPLQVADNLDRYAETAVAEVQRIRADGSQTKELRNTLSDIEATANLGRYYADKIRGAVDLALYRATGSSARQAAAVGYLEAAVSHWEDYARVASAQNEPQILARTRTLDWWQILEDVKQDVVIAREDIRPE